MVEERKEKREGEEKPDLEWEEVKIIVKKLKDGKTMGKDEIPNEVWKWRRRHGEMGVRNM